MNGGVVLQGSLHACDSATTTVYYYATVFMFIRDQTLSMSDLVCPGPPSRDPSLSCLSLGVVVGQRWNHRCVIPPPSWWLTSWGHKEVGERGTPSKNTRMFMGRMGAS